MELKQPDNFKAVNPDELFVPQQIEVETFITKIRDVKKVGNGHPTYTPTEFKEQFYFEDNGSLWININNVWKEFIPA